MIDLTEHCLQPDWPAPDNILAFTTLRTGGVSTAPHNSWNLADHVDDQALAVSTNRQQLAKLLPEHSRLYWLQQVHGDEIRQPEHKPSTEVPVGDAWFCQQPNQACCILTADCLPVLICDLKGRQVAAVHAGWRGVANQLLTKTMQHFQSSANQLLVWLGPCISTKHFRVGNDVRDALLSTLKMPLPEAHRAASEEGFSYVDLASIVRAQCHEFGVPAVYGGDYCSFSDAERFYSYRRDGQTGRNASLILRQE